MKTAVVKSTKDALVKRLRDMGHMAFAADAKVREVPKLAGHVAIQHPKLEALGDDGIFELCRFAQIPLAFVIEAPPIP